MAPLYLQVRFKRHVMTKETGSTRPAVFFSKY